MSLDDITDTLQILLARSYVNDFDFNNRSYRVYVQADSSSATIRGPGAVLRARRGRAR